MKIVKIIQTTLAAPFGSTDTQLTVSAFEDSKGNAAVLADFGSWVIIVLKQGSVTEMVKCDVVTQNDDGSCTLDVATNGRDLDPTSPYAGSSTGQDFSSGADAIVSNDPYTMSHFVNDEDDHTLAGKITFTQVPAAAADPVSDNDLTRKSYVAALVLGTLTTIDVIVPGTAGATIAAGNLIYYDDASNQWKLCDADDATTVNNVLLGIAQGAGVAAGVIANGVLLQGVDLHQSGLTIGQTYYASNTAGGISSSAGTTSVTVGIGKAATDLYFAPRFNQQLTQNQIDALAGDVGTPSGSNKFVTAQSLAAAILTSGVLNPTGAMSLYAGITAPTGWLMCDGSAVSRVTYAALYAILNPNIGTPTITIASPGVVSLTAHGLKQGDTVFFTTTGALPTGYAANTLYYVISAGLTADVFRLSATRDGSVINTSGSQSGTHTLFRSPFGLGDGSTTFNVPTFAGKAVVGRDPADSVFALGETGGEKTHTLTIAEMPAHTHPSASYAGGDSVGASAAKYGQSSSTASGSVPSEGGGGAHNILQPYITTNFIIKT